MKSECLDLDTLTRYITRKLPTDDKENVEAHIADCDMCREEWVLANKLMKESEDFILEPASAEITEAIFNKLGLIRKCYEWITGVFPTDWPINFELVFARDKAGKLHQEHSGFLRAGLSANDLNATMYIEKTPNKTVNIYFIVRKDNQKARNVRVTFQRKNGGIHSRLLDDDEYFKELPFGVYKIQIEQNGIEKGERYYEITEQRVEQK